jgi:hypothetical protein
MANEKTNPGQTAAQSGRLQVRDEHGNFLFHRQWLANYAIIDGPGKYSLPVTSKPQLFIPDPSEGTNPRYIVNVKAILKEDIPAIKEMLAGREYIEADELRPYFLTGTIWVNDEGPAPELPMKGELVDCAFDYVPNRDGEEVLRITSMNVLPAQKAPKVDLDAMFADDEQFSFDVPESADEAEEAK